MGADIHLYVEYNPFDGHETMRRAMYVRGVEFFVSRSYRLFGLLGYDRGRTGIEPVVPTKGIDQESLGTELLLEHSYSREDTTSEWDGRITDPHPSPYDAARLLPEYRNPDWHHDSWASFSELVQVREAYLKLVNYDPEHDDMPRVVRDLNLPLSMMCTLEAQGRETRALYWFDN